MPPLAGFTSPTPDTVFGFEVQHAFQFGETAPLSATHEIALVLHTTEGHSDENALQTFHQRGDPPHWTMDGDSMFLCIPLDRAAKALRHDEPANPANPRGFSPNSPAIQFEIAGFSKVQPWSLDDARLQRLAAAMAYSALHLGYSLDALAYPNTDWRDDKSDITTIWASNTRGVSGRRSISATRTPGRARCGTTVRSRFRRRRTTSTAARWPSRGSSCRACANSFRPCSFQREVTT